MTNDLLVFRSAQAGGASDSVELNGNAEQRVRVLHLNAGNLYGGVEALLTTVARFKHTCPNMEPSFGACFEDRWTRELAEAGVPVHVLGSVRISRPWTVWRARRRLQQVLEKEQFDLVICHMPWSFFVFGPAVKSAGVKLGFWAHAFHSGTGWLERLARRTTPDVAIANSRFTEPGLANLFPTARHVVIYPPVALAPHPPASVRAEVRRQLGVTDDTAVIIQVSRMEACKGHSIHVQALARLKNLPAKWVCWMVGGAQRPEEEEYLRQIHSSVEQLELSERVMFLGQRADVSELLAAADVFCQPNQTPDSFGISYIEALWAGLPVVTTAMGGAKEILNENCGYLVKPEPASIALALQELLQNPTIRAHFGSAGRSRAVELCDPPGKLEALRNLALSDRKASGK